MAGAMTNSKMIILRESLGLTRYKVAQDTGIHYDTLARIENPDTPTINRGHLRTLQEYYLEQNPELERLPLDLVLS